MDIKRRNGMVCGRNEEITSLSNHIVLLRGPKETIRCPSRAASSRFRERIEPTSMKPLSCLMCVNRRRAWKDGAVRQMDCHWRWNVGNYYSVSSVNGPGRPHAAEKQRLTHIKQLKGFGKVGSILPTTRPSPVPIPQSILGRFIHITANLTDLTSIVGPKCTLDVSYAAPLVSPGEYVDGRDRQTDGRQTVGRWKLRNRRQTTDASEQNNTMDAASITSDQSNFGVICQKAASPCCQPARRRMN